MDTAKIISTSERRIAIDIPGPWGSIRGSLRLPFRSGINPNVDIVRDNNIAWAIEIGLVAEDDHDLIDSIRRCRFEQLGALCHRDVSREALELITNCHTAIFVFDDMLDDQSSVIGSTTELAEHVTTYLSAAVADEPRPALRDDVPARDMIVSVGDAFVNVARRLLRYTDRHGLRYYVNNMRDYFQGCVMESKLRNKKMSTVAEYSVIRLRCSAVYPSLDIGAIVEGFDVSDDVRLDPAFETMMSATNLCVSYVNDLYSYAKESSAGEHSNLVTVYADGYGMTLREAMAAAMQTNDRVVEEYFEAKAHLEMTHGELDEATLGYVKIMQDWMRGNFDWYSELRTDRYTDYLTTAIPA